MTIKNLNCPVTQVTRGYYYHFFGYYDKSNWDPSGRYLLCLRTAPFKRYMSMEDLAMIGVLDAHHDFGFRPLSQTTAWNWQQGAQAAWLDRFGDGLDFIHNIRTSKGYASAIVNAGKPGEERLLPLPIYSVTADSHYALCLNYLRLRYTHPTIGYAAPAVPEPDPHPRNDGLFLMDIQSGDSRLVISLDDLCQLEHHGSMENACHWVTHVNPNPSGNRVAFLHRFMKKGESKTFVSNRLVAANIDGSEAVVLESDEPPFDRGYALSHPNWFGNDHIMIWHGPNKHYQRYHHRSGEEDIIGAEDLTGNGHFSQCPVNPDWMVSDTYPDQNGNHPLFLYQLSTETRLQVAHFRHDPEISGDTRCDLHPRWSRDGRTIGVDCSMNHDRQMYLVDVSNCPHLVGIAL